MSYFPIILIPDAIEQTRVAQPPVIAPPCLPVPVHPGDPPKKMSTILIGVQSANIVVLSFITADIASSNLIGTLVLIGGLGAITFGAWQQFTNYSKRKKEHQEKVGIGRRQQKDNERQTILHCERLQAEQTPRKIAEFRYKLLLSILSKTIPHDGDDSGAEQGDTEISFHPYLKTYFSDKIHTKLKVQNPALSEGYHYTPDFSYIDEKFNLCIDIEIDEPYAYKSRKPIHYSGKDTRRNNYFLGRGWLVIRFSEEQIVKYPASCCKTVAETIAHLLDDNSILKKFQNVISLPRTEQWTYEEAEKMAGIEYRRTYMNK